MLNKRISLAIVIPLIVLLIGTVVMFDNRLATAATTPKAKIWTVNDCTKCHADYGHSTDPKYANSSHTQLKSALSTGAYGTKAPASYSLPYK